VEADGRAEGDENDDVEADEEEQEEPEEIDYFTTQSSTAVSKINVEDENRKGKVATGIEKGFGEYELSSRRMLQLAHRYTCPSRESE
jgi:hypothetical protein